LLVLPDQIGAVGAGDEEFLTAARLRASLERAKETFRLRRVALVARDLTGRGDTAGRIALGAVAHEFSADAVELDRAASGLTTAAPMFVGHDGLVYRRAYAPVGAPGDVAGFVAVEASADYLQALAAFRRWLIVAGTLGLGAIALFVGLFARRLTGPLGRLAAAAERIGRGELADAVPVETRDEVGLLAARLDEMRAALRDRDQRLQMMLAGIAHEVRNPLGGLTLYAGLLREALADQPERLGEVARIDREIGYLKNVVTDFLEYARRPRPELAPVELAPLYQEVVEVAQGDELAHGGRPAVTLEVPAGLAVLADRSQLRRVLLNLARNALQAAGRDGQVVLCGAPVEGARHLVECQVRDSGPGVAAELRPKIFDPFFTTREKGTGLGLAFVREIVRDLGGEVAVDTAAEGGARFRFRLPAAGF
jgi:signal transduction histidine kinase